MSVRTNWVKEKTEKEIHELWSFYRGKVAKSQPPGKRTGINVEYRQPAADYVWLAGSLILSDRTLA